MSARCSIAAHGVWWLAVVALVSIAGCSDDIGPGDTSTTGSLGFSGGYDADFQEFSLAAAAAESSLADHFGLELVCGGLEIDPTTQRLSLQVAIHNLGAMLHPPVVLWLQDFSLPAVALDNPDLVVVAGQAFGLALPAAGYDYSELLGEDGVLASGETSRYKHWQLRDPLLQSFSCTGRIDAGLTPGVPRLAGRVWLDRNVNGLMDAGEAGATNARVLVETPESAQLRLTGDSEGRISLPLASPGWYRLNCDAGSPSSPPFYITPNPLEIAIGADGHGDPQSFEAADFGITWGGGPGTENVVHTGDPLEGLHAAPWTYIDALIAWDSCLSVRLGFDGCEAEQSWACYVGWEFTGSDPVQVDAVLVRDSYEDCTMAHQGVVSFGLAPLITAFQQTYIHGDTLQVNLLDFAGQIHPLRFYVRDKDEGK